MKYLTRIVNTTLDIIAPPKCATCDTNVEKINTLCPKCWGDLIFIGAPKCSICSNTFPINQFETTCFDCKAINPDFDKVVSSVVYNELSEQLVFGLKYNDRIDYSEIIAEFIKTSMLKESDLPDILIPIPLHKNKLKKRGFNQATLIAKKLAQKLNIPIEYNLLSKIKDNISQSGLDREERFSNVANVYKINDKFKSSIKSKHICIVDDVITTGATVNECAKLLKKYGAHKVTCASFARTIK